MKKIYTLIIMLGLAQQPVFSQYGQFTFDFGLPITDSKEETPEKIVHTLSEENEEIKEDVSIAEAVDFKFEVLEKPQEKPDLDASEKLNSPNDDSPFDQTIKESAIQENEKRKEKD